MKFTVHPSRLRHKRWDGPHMLRTEALDLDEALAILQAQRQTRPRNVKRSLKRTLGIAKALASPGSRQFKKITLPTISIQRKDAPE